MSELYTLPDGWEWKNLSDVFNIERGGSPRPIKDYFTEDEDGINWIKISDATKGNGKYIESTEQKIKPSGLKNTRLVVDGDFIMSNSMSFGKPYIVKTKGAIHDGWLLMREKIEKTDKDFFYYLLSSNYMYEQFSSKASGTTVKNLNIDMVKTTNIPLPPLEEQKRIVAKLDNLFAKIDKAIALHQKNIDEANVFMASVLNDVFVELEEKYGLNILSEVVKINSGIALPSIFKDKESMNGEYEFFKVAQMNNDKRVMKGADLNFTLNQSKEFKIKLFPKGSILIPKRGGAILTNKKRIMERDASYDSNIMGLKADNKILSDEFLFVYLDSINLCDFVDTSTIPQINNKHIDMMNISLPPLKTQQKVVSYLDEISQKMEKIKQIQKEKMQSLKALKASILDQAFKGEL